jgi:hypothetical protein
MTSCSFFFFLALIPLQALGQEIPFWRWQFSDLKRPEKAKIEYLNVTAFALKTYPCFEVEKAGRHEESGLFEYKV